MEEYKLTEVRVKLAEGTGLYSTRPVDCPDSAVDLMRDFMKDLDRECVCVINFDTKCRPINFNIVSVGSVNMSVAPPANIFKTAILSNAASIMMVHNHPSGDITPSNEDIAVTKNISKLSEMMDIKLLDHIIIGGGTGDYYSFLEHGNVLKGSGSDSVREAGARYSTADRVKELTDKLEAGIQDLFGSDRYKDYLSVMGRFHHYSLNNTILIYMQRPDATHVAGYTSWQRNFDRQVMKGEKGIRIFQPAPYKKSVEVTIKDKATMRPVLDKDGRPKKEIKEIMVPAYKAATVFDVSQTEGKELPDIARELTADVEHAGRFKAALESISPVSIEIADIRGAAKGYYDLQAKKIVIRSGMSDAQTIKTMVHEISHAILHDNDTGAAKDADRSTREVQAESVAYTVCQYYGIDTSDYSFGYVAGWSNGRDVGELKDSLGTIRSAASGMIDKIDRELIKAEERGASEERDVGKVLAETAERLSVSHTRRR